MFKVARRRVGRLVRPFVGSDHSMASPRNTHLQLKLPNPYGGQPWLSATLAVSSVPRGYGRLLHLRAHLDGRLSMPQRAFDRASLAHDVPDNRDWIGQGRRAAASVVRGVIERLPAERVARLGARRWRSWLDVQVSTAPLDGGADALMPRALREIYAGGLPRLGPNQPRVGVWSGPAGGPNGGIARLAMIQIDEDDVSGATRDPDDERFNLSLSIAQVIEPVIPGDGDHHD